MDRTVVVVASAWYWFAAFVVMFVACLVTVPLRLVGVPYRMVHAISSGPLFAMVMRLNGTRTQVDYEPRFDRRRPSLFCQNHVNLLDAFVASAALPQAFCGVMLAWQFKIPVYGWMMWASMGIPVQRQRADRIVEATTRAARDRVRRGLSILAFPEGARTRDGDVHRFRRGMFVVAREAGLPVVPVAVRGLFEINRAGSRLFRPGRVQVHVGEQVETHGLTDEQLGALADKFRDVVRHFVLHGEWRGELLRAPEAVLMRPPTAEAGSTEVAS